MAVPPPLFMISQIYNSSFNLVAYQKVVFQQFIVGSSSRKDRPLG